MATGQTKKRNSQRKASALLTSSRSLLDEAYEVLRDVMHDKAAPATARALAARALIEAQKNQQKPGGAPSLAEMSIDEIDAEIAKRSQDRDK